MESGGRLGPTDGMEGEGGEGGEEEGGESPSVEGVLEEVMQWDCDGLDRVGSGGTVWTAVDASRMGVALLSAEISDPSSSPSPFPCMVWGPGFASSWVSGWGVVTDSRLLLGPTELGMGGATGPGVSTE